jgi:hypothetical protein
VAGAELTHRVGQVDDASARSIDVEHVGFHTSRVRANTLENFLRLVAATRSTAQG